MEASPPHGPSTKRKDRDAAGPAEPPAGCGKKLLAGYLAHDFLSSGMVLGERRGVVTGAGAVGRRTAPAGYEAVAMLVQCGGARVPGVVNPAQLAAWAGTGR